jgi:predicted ATPase
LVLTRAEQQLFERFSVFAGGVRPEGGPKGVFRRFSVGGSGAQLARRQIAKVVGATDRPGRYRLPESLRAYSSDRLRDAGQLEAWRLRHAQHFASGAYAAMEGRQSPTLMQISPEDVDNMREALVWSRSGDRRVHLQLAIALWLVLLSGGLRGRGSRLA